MSNTSQKDSLVKHLSKLFKDIATPRTDYKSMQQITTLIAEIKAIKPTYVQNEKASQVIDTLEALKTHALIASTNSETVLPEKFQALYDGLDTLDGATDGKIDTDKIIADIINQS